MTEEKELLADSSELITEPAQAQKKGTLVIEKELIPEHPFCRLPEHFFDRVSVVQQKETQTPLFKIESWSGRPVFSVERSEKDLLQ